MELLFGPRVPVPPFITGERYAGPIMVCKMIYVKIDYTVGSRPTYIDPIPVQSLGYLTPSLEAMIKQPIDAIQGYRPLMHTHTYRSFAKVPQKMDPIVQSRDAKLS